MALYIRCQQFFQFIENDYQFRLAGRFIGVCNGLGDQPTQYSIGSDKVVNLFGRERDIYFSGLLVQKGYVGFYFMPVYTNPSLVKELHPDLAKCLKGKSCFHIKKNDPALREHIKDALKLGYDDYKKKGWI